MWPQSGARQVERNSYGLFIHSHVAKGDHQILCRDGLHKVRYRRQLPLHFASLFPSLADGAECAPGPGNCSQHNVGLEKPAQLDRSATVPNGPTGL